MHSLLHMRLDLSSGVKWVRPNLHGLCSFGVRSRKIVNRARVLRQPRRVNLARAVLAQRLMGVWVPFPFLLSDAVIDPDG